MTDDPDGSDHADGSDHRHGGDVHAATGGRPQPDSEAGPRDVEGRARRRPPGSPPAGLAEQLPTPAPRPTLGAGVAVLLALAAAAAFWAALTGAGPALADWGLLDESIEARTGGLTAVAVVLTDVGSTAAMAVLAVAVGAWLWYRGRRADAVFVVGTMAGASAVFRGLKIFFDRPRPPAVDRLVNETNESLPSGHATMSIVVIGSLVVLAWAGRRVAARVAMVVAAAIWVGAVGATRIYLGVHWFSDVLAGWLVGGAWLALCVALWSWWRARTAARRSTSGALAR
jgi:membrane-associated phospholipid phosphatase